MAAASTQESSDGKRGSVLVVDDEVELTNALVEMLARQGFETAGFTNGNLALEALRKRSFDALLADLMMPEIDGMTLIREALKINPDMITVMMTGQGTVQTAVEAMKSGAYDYILKPFKLNTVVSTLSRSLEVRRLRVENVQLREMVHIYELGQAVASSLDESAIFQQTAEAILQECQADEVSILLPVQDDDSLEVVSVSGDERDMLVGQKVPVDGTIDGWVARNRELLTIPGEVDDPRFAALHPRPEIQFAALMPIELGKKFFGVINVNITRKARALSKEQITGLRILANIAASAVENARLYEQTEKRLRRLSALRAIDLAITSSLDLRVTLEVLLDQVSTQLNVEAAAILLYHRYSEALTFAAGRGFPANTMSDYQTALGVGYAGQAAMDRSTLLVPDLAAADPDPLLEHLRVSQDFRAGLFTPLISKGEIEGVLAVFQRQPLHPDREWLEFFEALAGQAAIAINNTQLFDNLQRTNQQLVLAYNTTIEGWSRALDLRDKETEGHTQRVTDMALRLARAMDVFDEEDLLHFRRGALLHDIGKMGVPDDILLKPGDLTGEEEGIMRRHPEYANQLLSPIPYLRKALDIPHYHHERWDGAGYPAGLKGEQIPLAARIFSVVDVWDALRSDRPYRDSWPQVKVLQYIRDLSGKQFDPAVVEAFLGMVAQDRDERFP